VYCHIPTALFFPFPFEEVELICAIYSLLIFSATETSLGVASKAGLRDELDWMELLSFEAPDSGFEGGRVCRMRARLGFS
jgi:hypothetical protein